MSEAAVETTEQVRPRRRQRVPRGRALFVVALITTTVVVASLAYSPEPPRPSEPAAAAVAASNVESSAWYCTGMTGGSGGIVDGTVVLSSTAEATREVSVRVVNDSGQRTSTKVFVPAGGSASVRPSTLLQGSWLAVDLQVLGGGVAASEIVTGPLGMATAPCTSTVSTRWAFAAGDTTPGHETYLALFNPGSRPAVVSDLFFTPSGRSAPQPFQAVVVPPHATLTQRIGGFLQRTNPFGTVVTTLSGQVAASEVVVSSTASVGVILQAGQLAPDHNLGIPALSVVDHQQATVNVVNPSRHAISATVTPHLQSSTEARSWELQVPAQSIASVEVSSSSRIPSGTLCSITIKASGGGAYAAWTSSVENGERSGYGGAAALGLSNASLVDRAIIPAIGERRNPWVPGLGSSSVVVTPLGGSGTTSVVLNRLNLKGTLVTFDLKVIPMGSTKAFALPEGKQQLALSPVYVHVVGRAMVGEVLTPTLVPGTATSPALPIDAQP